jgi:hypothetical protein
LLIKHIVTSDTLARAETPVFPTHTPFTFPTPRL